jgi:hypothetical protein
MHDDKLAAVFQPSMRPLRTVTRLPPHLHSESFRWQHCFPNAGTNGQQNDRGDDDESRRRWSGLRPSAPLESVLTDEGTHSRHRHLCQQGAHTERVLANVDERVGECHCRQRGAPVECVFANVGERVGECHCRQRGAPVERVVADVGERVGECHCRQRGAPEERFAAKVSERVGERYRRERGALVERLCANVCVSEFESTTDVSEVHTRNACVSMVNGTI